MPIVLCDQCGKQIDRPLYPSNNSKHHFCNHKCRGEWKSKHGHVRVACAFCGNSVYSTLSRAAKSENIFCNRVCFSNWSKHPRNRKCEYCGTPLHRSPSHIKQCKIHFCNRTCKGKWHSENLIGGNSPSWKGGRTVYYGPGWIYQKRAARKRDGYRCQLCGVSEKKYKKALDVHHIIPFREFGYIPGKNENNKQANKLSNLICFCSRCHIQAEYNYVSFQLPLLTLVSET